MKKIILIISLLSISLGQSQNATVLDYEVINALSKNFKQIDNSDKIVLTEKSIAFENLDYFFGKKYIEDFISSTPNLSKKEKYFLRNLDFDFLKKQKRETVFWDFSYLKAHVRKFTENENNITNNVYSFSLPIFTDDNKTAFVYSSSLSSFFLPGFKMICILKYKNKKWKVYKEYVVEMG